MILPNTAIVAIFFKKDGTSYQNIELVLLQGPETASAGRLFHEIQEQKVPSSESMHGTLISHAY